MKAIRIHEDGGPEVLRYEDVPDPEPRDGEVLVELRAASLNHLDVWIRKGLPVRSEAAHPRRRRRRRDRGHRRARRHQPGHPARTGRCTIIGETCDGTHAELIAVPARLRPPDPRRPVVRGGGGVPAHLRDRLPDARHARAGCSPASGCSSGASAAASRARRSRSRRRSARSVVVDVVERREARPRTRARRRRDGEPRDRRRGRRRPEVTGGGAHVVVDDVGEATWKRTLDAARPEGRVVVCGATTGPNPPAALHRVWWKQLSILGSTMGTPEDFRGVYDLIDAGKVRPVVDSVFPLAEAARGARAARGRRAARQDRPHDPGLNDERPAEAGRSESVVPDPKGSPVYGPTAVARRDRRGVDAGERVARHRRRDRRGHVDLPETAWSRRN